VMSFLSSDDGEVGGAEVRGSRVRRGVLRVGSFSRVGVVVVGGGAEPGPRRRLESGGVGSHAGGDV